MKEIKLDENICGDVRRRRFFVIKNDKGYYQHYTHHSKWTEYLCNAELYNSERGAIDEAICMLEDRQNYLEKGDDFHYHFNKDFAKSFEKVFVVEVELKEMDSELK